ncbi:MAG: SDR family NAD(P)-dependent oxidoreductase [Ilumatobacteraceae bacterium]
MDVTDKVAFVVGGASGMARATAEGLHAKGAHVAIIDRPESAGAEVAEALGGTFHPVDVTDHVAAEAALAAAFEAHGSLSVAVNTAGGGRAGRTLSKDGPMALEDFQYVVDLNLIATFNLNRLQAWYMSGNEPNEDGERGVIINTASIAAFEGQIGQVSYSAAKAGIAGMSLTMARDLGTLGIRVNAIAPSLFATGSTARLTDDKTARLTEDNAFPRRMGKPEEYARLALAIVDNPMLNGGTIRLDAGQRFAPR